MYKSLLFILISALTIAFTIPNTGQAAEQNPTGETAKVIQIIYIDDEQEPEFIAILDNQLRLICKWHDGLLFAGQPIGLEYGEDRFELHATTYDKEGQPKGNMVLYRLGDDPRFYQSR